MEIIFCPICKKTHESVPFKCDCGYEEDRFDAVDYDDQKQYYFSIYKFSKLIFNKKIEWNQSKYARNDYVGEDIVAIQEIYEDKAVAYVDLQVENKTVYAEPGILAFNYNVCSLIINVDELDHEMLDESGVRILFIGDRVKYINEFINLSLKYIEVDKNNPYFTAKNNVLFTKDMKELILYANLKEDEDYYIPKTVKRVRPWAFVNVYYGKNKLKVIHCSKDVKFEDTRVDPSIYDKVKIVRDVD